MPLIIGNATLHEGDCMEVLKGIDAESVQCCVTSPPYWGLRDYGVDGQLGLEKTPEEYVEKMVKVFREVKRVLRDDGTLWLNLGSSYAGGGNGCHGKGWENDAKIPLCATPRLQNFKPKDLVPIPWMVAMALQSDGWYLRQDIIWAKPNPMPESVTDRCTKAHEYIFLLTKSAKYFYDSEAIQEKSIYFDKDKRSANRRTMHQESKYENMKEYSFNGAVGYLPNGNRNRRSVWTITTKPFKEAHFATFPPEIPEICIRAGTSERGCCPECGSPWERVTEKAERIQAHWEGTKQVHALAAKGKHGATSVIETGSYQTYKTTGWRPTCAHDQKPTPCTVLDPFSGAATTGVVAHKLSRKFIGIELNPRYIDIAVKRLEQHQRQGVLPLG